MRSLHLSVSVLGLLLAGVAACGDDGGSSSAGNGGSSGDGGGGGAGNGPAGPSGSGATSGSASGGTPTSSASGTPSSASAGGQTSSASGGQGGDGGGGGSGPGTCFDDPVFEDLVCDACVQDGCCDELTACLDDFETCTTDGAIDASTEVGADLLACMSDSCREECGFGGICDSGIGYGDDALDACVGEACCDEFNECTDGGSDTQSCFDCYEAGGGPLCDAAIACAAGSGCFCGDGELRCDDGLCLPQQLVCDGTPHCEDGTDEEDCGGDCDDVATQCADLVYTACTCAFNDPCAWSGDGFCDDACADFTANPFDDAADCGGPCQNVANECASGQYTECTCAFSDPCGWQGDGVCDLPCEQISGNPFDDAADCASDDLVVSCTDPDDPIWAPECSCISNGGNGAPTYEGVGCAGGFGSGQFCCEDAGFPESGGSCRCYDDTGPNWSCISPSAEFCTCGFDDSAPGGGPCDDVPGPNGVPWLCCASAADNQCYCYENSFGDTCGDDTPVTNCAVVPGGWQTPPQSCPGGTTQVQECSPGGACDSDFDCPGDCFGDDPFCCPTCSGGSCETCCVSGGGSVSCF